MEKLFKLVYDYSISGRLADKNFLVDACNIIVDYKSLRNYIRFLDINNQAVDNSDVVRLASFFPGLKKVQININHIKYYLDYVDNRYGSLFTETENMFHKNFVISQALLHEAEHAEHQKVFENSELSTESRLLRIALRESRLFNDGGKLYMRLKEEGFSDAQMESYLKRKQELYIQYYDYNPDERLAQIRAYSAISNMLGSLNKQMPSLCEFEQACYIESLLAGYQSINDTISCPTITYFVGMGYHDEFRGFDFYDDYPKIMQDNIFQKHDMIERFSLGLPVTTEEYGQVQKVLRATNKYSCN